MNHFLNVPNVVGDVAGAIAGAAGADGPAASHEVTGVMNNLGTFEQSLLRQEQSSVVSQEAAGLWSRPVGSRLVFHNVSPNQLGDFSARPFHEVTVNMDDPNLTVHVAPEDDIQDNGWHPLWLHHYGDNNHPDGSGFLVLVRGYSGKFSPDNTFAEMIVMNGGERQSAWSAVRATREGWDGTPCLQYSSVTGHHLTNFQVYGETTGIRVSTQNQQTYQWDTVHCNTLEN